MRNQPLHPHTAAINNKQKNLSKIARYKALTWLAKEFPNAFDNSLQIQPLKIGILDDILFFAEQAEKAGISKSKLREAVVIFTRRLDYLACLKAREMRIDLHGQPTTQVSDEEAEYARLKIRRRIEKSAQNTRTTAPKKQVRHRPMLFETQMPEPLTPLSTTPQTPTRTKPVHIKHKTARSFDPNAVARLKEKLGIIQKEEASVNS